MNEQTEKQEEAVEQEVVETEKKPVKLTRQLQKKTIKAEMKNLFDELGISRSEFKRQMKTIKVLGRGESYILPENQDRKLGLRPKRGHKMGLKQQYSFLKDAVVRAKELRELFEEEMKKLEEKKTKEKEDTTFKMTEEK